MLNRECRVIKDPCGFVLCFLLIIYILPIKKKEKESKEVKNTNALTNQVNLLQPEIDDRVK